MYHNNRNNACNLAIPFLWLLCESASDESLMVLQLHMFRSLSAWALSSRTDSNGERIRRNITLRLSVRTPFAIVYMLYPSKGGTKA